jgi:uncharacterized protein (DUF111 family)
MNRKKGRLLFVQVDHVSAEVTGFAVGRIMDLGARNVQLIPSITKKNRPGAIFIIDTDDRHEEAIALFLARELKVAGYHRIETLHLFQQISFQQRDLVVKAAGTKRTITCDVKIVGDPADPLSIDVEHDALVKIQKLLNKKNRACSLGELRTAIESKLRRSKRTILLDI